MSLFSRLVWCYSKLIKALFFAGLLFLAADFLFPLNLSRTEDYSTIITDYRGDMLHVYQTPNGYWRLPVTINKVDQRFVSFLQNIEDKRFYYHPGFDPFAILRAIWQMLDHGKVISGASTITMQTARLLEPRPRNIFSKFIEMFRALQLETRYDKSQILEMYLNLASYGGNIQGVRAASVIYFGKEPLVLSDAEIAFLISLPQSPERNRPDRHYNKSILARNFILDRLQAAELISEAEAIQAKSTSLPEHRTQLPRLAPHLSQRFFKISSSLESTKQVHLSLDKDLQSSLEKLAQNKQAFLQNQATLAILVVENKTGYVRAYVGSGGYYNRTILGQNDMIQAIRSPGSTLKPFIYGLAFDQLFLHPETVISDSPVRFGDYAPKNFDKQYYGNITVSRALQLSLNIPAVLVLNRLGPDYFMEWLKNNGVQFRLPGNIKKAGLPIALGGIGINLEQLVMLYSGLANGGIIKKLNYVSNSDNQKTTRALGATSAWQIYQILKDSPMPPGMIAPKYLFNGHEIAFKTGTSYGFRDAWAIGFDKNYTVGIWIGRPDGSFAPYRIGREEAAPILMDVFKHLPVLPHENIEKPIGYQETVWQDLPESLKYFQQPSKIPTKDQIAEKNTNLKIIYPINQAVIELSSEPTYESITIESTGGKGPFIWFINGRQVDFPPYRRKISWNPSSLGFARITVIDRDGNATSIEIWLKDKAI